MPSLGSRAHCIIVSNTLDLDLHYNTLRLLSVHDLIALTLLSQPVGSGIVGHERLPEIERGLLPIWKAAQHIDVVACSHMSVPAAQWLKEPTSQNCFQSLVGQHVLSQDVLIVLV